MQLVKEGEQANEPQDPKNGSTYGENSFVGWYQDAGHNISYDFNSAEASDLTLYAKWTIICTNMSDAVVKQIYRHTDSNIDPVVENNVGERLTEGTDYTITIESEKTGSAVNNMKDPGFYNLTVTGKGSYSGEKTVRVCVLTFGKYNPEYDDCIFSDSYQGNVAFDKPFAVEDEGASTPVTADPKYIDGKTLIPCHAHNFTYEVKGQSIIATCHNYGCDLEQNKATLSLDGPGTGTVTYDGSKKPATVIDESSISGDAVIFYQKKNSNSWTDMKTAVPKDVGEYRAGITLVDEGNHNTVTVYTEYIIKPASVKVSGITASDKIYDGKTAATIDCTRVVLEGRCGNDELTVNEELMETFSDLFRPEDAVNRSEMEYAVKGLGFENYEELSICSGLPESGAINREQVAAALYKCVQAVGKGFEGSWMFLLDYPDADQISDDASEPMHWMVMNGI